jgi:hypothetical protein
MAWRSHLRAFVLIFGMWCMLSSVAAATLCNQLPEVNPVLFGCHPSSQTCTIPGGSAPLGCELDFGARKVIFKGTFDVANTTLIVRAGQIEVQGALMAKSANNQRGGMIRLTAIDSIIVSGAIDVSGKSAGFMRLQAGGPIGLPAGAVLRSRGIEVSSTGNSASGGAIDLIAGTSITDLATIDLSGGPGGGGGSLTMQAGTTMTVGQSIDATGGSGDGGDVDFLAGDDITIQGSIDVSSTSAGASGDMRVRAGSSVTGSWCGFRRTIRSGPITTAART